MGKGRGRGGGQGHGHCNNSRHHNIGPFKNKKGNSNQEKLPNPQATTGQSITQRQLDNTCYRCGMTGHWSRTCRTAKHLVDLYQASIKYKGNNIEVNFLNDDGDGGVDLTHFDVSDHCLTQPPSFYGMNNLVIQAPLCLGVSFTSLMVIP